LINRILRGDDYYLLASKDQIRRCLMGQGKDAVEILVLL